MIASLTSYQESTPPAEAAPPAPAASTPPAEPAAPTPAAAAESTPDASPAATPEAPKSESAPAPSAEPTPAPAPPRQKSLEEVKEEIRLILQKQKGEKTLKAKMQGVIDSTLVPYRMDKYESARRDYEASHPAKEGAIDWTGFVPPPIPDMTKVAESLGAQLKTAGPVGVAELDKLGPLASAVRVDRRAGTGVPESLRRLAFGPNIGDDLYAGRMLFDVASGNCFVYWKTKDEPPKPQSLEEVKDQVIVLWRQESALPKAKELAQQIIDKAKGSEGKLDAGLPADQGMSVQSTDIFPRVRMIASSVTPGFEQPIEVKIANIPGAGEAFLDAAFKLKEGEFTVLADEKEENVYAVKVSKRIEPDFAAFAQRYRNDNVLRRQYAQYLGRETQALVMRQLLQEAKIDPPLFQPRQREMESSDSPVNTEG
jgi:hypothetical protein